MLQKYYQYTKPVVLYLTYFCMVCGMAMAMVYSGSIFNSLGFKICTVGMFAFWITFFALKFNWFDDALFLSKKAALWLGLLSSSALLVLQVYIRYTYGHYGFISMPRLLPTYAYLEAYQAYLIFGRYVLVGILGFSLFNIVFAEGDNVGYDFVEVTTYFTDSGFAYNQTVSDIKTAVWGYIVVGLTTTILPFLVSMNPLVILVLGFCLLRLLKHRSKKAVWLKRIAIWVVCLLACGLFAVMHLEVELPIRQDALLGYQLAETADGESYYEIKAVRNETVATHITIPETYKNKPVRVESDSEVFARCDKIKWVKASADMAKYFPQAEELSLTSGPSDIEALFSYKAAALKRLKIAYDAESIGYQAFRYFDRLEEVVLPNSIKIIGMQAFYGCKALNAINLPDGLQEIGEYAFADCESLTAVNIPQGVTEIGSLAFCNCTSLTSVTLPEGLIVLKNSVFNGCAITTLVVPQSVTEIGASALANCKELATVQLGSQVVTIRDEAFCHCDVLTSIVLPTTLERVSWWAFYNMPTILYYEGSAAEWNAISTLSDGGHANPGQFYPTVKFYSETEAEGCWHYGTNGEIVEW